jgi:hypothetical protein
VIGAVEVVNRAQFEEAVATSIRELSTEVPSALAEVSRPLMEEANFAVPVDTTRPDDPHPGMLRGSYAVVVEGSTALWVTSADYGAGAEWGSHQKWSGFEKYGPPGRFVERVMVANEEELPLAIFERLRNAFELQGFARMV